MSFFSPVVSEESRPPEPLQKNLGHLAACLRILIGLLFLYHGIPKISWEPLQMEGVLNFFLQNQPPVWYADFLRNFCLPRAGLFTALVAWGEVVVGLFYLLGFLTPLTALAGVVMNLNYLFAVWGMSPPLTSGSGFNALLVVVHLFLGLSHAGRTWGLDGFLSRRSPVFLRLFL